MTDWDYNDVPANGLDGAIAFFWYDDTVETCDPGVMVQVAESYGAVAAFFYANGPVTFGETGSTIPSISLNLDIGNPIALSLVDDAGTTSDFSISIIDAKSSVYGSYEDFRFVTVRHWGEDPTGTWTLKVVDTTTGDDGTFHSWSMDVYGTTHGRSCLDATGGYLFSGESRDVYLQTTHCSTTCDPVKGSITCENGNLTGDTTYSHTSCTPSAIDVCGSGNSGKFFSIKFF